MAVLGAGTVGARSSARCSTVQATATGRRRAAELVAVAVRDVDRAVPRASRAELLTDAPAHLVADAEIDVIVELMGGDEPAHTLIAAALARARPS